MNLEGFYPIKNYKLYMINKNGTVISTRRFKNHILITGRYTYGYVSVHMKKDDNKFKRKNIQDLLYTTFIGDIPDGLHILHKNGDRTDNRLENFELVTEKEIVNFHYLKNRFE
jgi:hypothetical protein